MLLRLVHEGVVPSSPCDASVQSAGELGKAIHCPVGLLQHALPSNDAPESHENIGPALLPRLEVGGAVAHHGEEGRPRDRLDVARGSGFPPGPRSELRGVEPRVISPGLVEEERVVAEEEVLSDSTLLSVRTKQQKAP